MLRIFFLSLMRATERTPWLSRFVAVTLKCDINCHIAERSFQTPQAGPLLDSCLDKGGYRAAPSKVRRNISYLLKSTSHPTVGVVSPLEIDRGDDLCENEEIRTPPARTGEARHQQFVFAVRH